jgi:predicted transcriptional regulator
MTNVVEMTVAAVDTPTKLPRGERIIEKLNMMFLMLQAQRDDTADAILNQIFDELREMDKPETVMNGLAEILHRKITRDPNIDIVLAKITHPDGPVEYVTWIQNKDDV